MTESSRILLISIALFVMGAAVPAISEAKGPPVKEILVEEAIPNFAETGELGKPLVLKGRNFPSHAKITFIFDSGGTGNVTTVEDVISSTSKSEFQFHIDVPDVAGLGGYNIQVEEWDITAGRLTGRKGKGTTTLFSVRQANKAVHECADVFGGNGYPVPTSCNCQFTASDSTPDIMNLAGPCETRETLYLTHNRINGNPDYTITAKGPFMGNAVFASTDSGEMLRGASIYLDATINDGFGAGCGSDQLNSFIKFVLDDSSSAAPNSQLLVDFHNLAADQGVVVCHAIEFSRDDTYPDGPDFKIDVDDNVIADGVYEKTGILFRGFGPLTGRLGRLSVSNNTIGVPAAVNAAQANGIQFGPAYGEGTVERNNIRSSGGTGILVLGGNNAMEMTIGHNDVDGAWTAILVDGYVPNSQINSNYLVGDSQTNDDVGICQANVNRIRSNKFVNISEEIVTDDDSIDCLDRAVPAN